MIKQFHLALRFHSNRGLTMLTEFHNKISAHSQHVLRVGEHCTTEETTKQALILPLLDILGFSAYDPTKVRAEYTADLAGVKNGERVDYALFCQSIPVIFIEAKSYNENLNNHAPQLMRYFNASPEVEFAVITNGREWRFFTDLKNKNVMDDKPFLTINFEKLDPTKIAKLSRFCHDNFQADTLRVLAEESAYLSMFTKTISSSLKEVDPDFVRFVASHSNIGRQLTQKFIETITPLVKQAVEKSVSDMVVSGLSSNSPSETLIPANNVSEQEVSNDDSDVVADIIDPNNSKIITTINEQEAFNFTLILLGDNESLECKDTESYFSVLYQGKTNRWVYRYYDKQRAYITVPIELTEQHKQEITRAKLQYNGNTIYLERPENILRLGSLLHDCLDYCKNDENFRMKKS